MTLESRDTLYGTVSADGTAEDGGIEWYADTGDSSSSTFLTVFQERSDGGPLIVSNHITGGPLSWIQPTADPVEITMERPPFGGYTWQDGEEPVETVQPVTLTPLSETENVGTTARDWMEEHWAEWMEDARFAREQDRDFHQLTDQDRQYSYIADEDSFRGQGVSVYDNATQDPVLFVDLFSYLFPDNAAAALSDSTDAQSLRWARLIDNVLYFSNASSLGSDRTGGKNAYLTAIDPWDGVLLWRSDPLVCSSQNFAVLRGVGDGGGILLCGYGCGNDSCTLCQVSMETGQVLDRTPIAGNPEWLVCANGYAYVYCSDRNYVFAIKP